MNGQMPHYPPYPSIIYPSLSHVLTPSTTTTTASASGSEGFVPQTSVCQSNLSSDRSSSNLNVPQFGPKTNETNNNPIYSMSGFLPNFGAPNASCNELPSWAKQWALPASPFQATSGPNYTQPNPVPTTTCTLLQPSFNGFRANSMDRRRRLQELREKCLHHQQNRCGQENKQQAENGFHFDPKVTCSHDNKQDDYKTLLAAVDVIRKNNEEFQRHVLNHLSELTRVLTQVKSAINDFTSELSCSLASMQSRSHSVSIESDCELIDVINGIEISGQDDSTQEEQQTNQIQVDDVPKESNGETMIKQEEFIKKEEPTCNKFVFEYDPTIDLDKWLKKSDKNYKH